MKQDQIEPFIWNTSNANWLHNSVNGEYCRNGRGVTCIFLTLRLRLWVKHPFQHGGRGGGLILGQNGVTSFWMTPKFSPMFFLLGRPVSVFRTCLEQDYVDTESVFFLWINLLKKITSPTKICLSKWNTVTIRIWMSVGRIIWSLYGSYSMTHATPCVNN